MTDAGDQSCYHCRERSAMGGELFCARCSPQEMHWALARALQLSSQWARSHSYSDLIKEAADLSRRIDNVVYENVRLREQVGALKNAVVADVLSSVREAPADNSIEIERLRADNDAMSNRYADLLATLGLLVKEATGKWDPEAEWPQQARDALKVIKTAACSTCRRLDCVTANQHGTCPRCGVRDGEENSLCGQCVRAIENRVEVDRYRDMLHAIWLYADWRYVTKQLTTEQKELWADAIDWWSKRNNPRDAPLYVQRWWRNSTTEST